MTATSGAPNRPASSLVDDLANAEDPATRALWAAHQERMRREVERIEVAPPSPGLAERDPYALRFAVALIAFAAAIVAGPELYGRLAAAFDWRGGDAAAIAAASRVDVWIDPPPYAGRPPLVIDLKSPEPQKVAALEDSTLVVRGDPGAVEIRAEGGIHPADPKAPANAPERRFTIQSDGKATILVGGGQEGGARLRRDALPASRRSSSPRSRSPISAER